MKNITQLAQAGYTLVEILVALIVGAIIIGAASGIIVTQTNLSQRNRDTILTSAFAEAKIEALRSAGFIALSDGTTDITNELPDELKAPRNASLEVTSFSVSVKKAVLTITYSEQGAARTYTYTTLIGELGAGQY